MARSAYVASSGVLQPSVFIFGGYKADSSYDSVTMSDVEQLDPDSWTWSTRGNWGLSAARAYTQAVAVDTDSDGFNNGIFVLGGGDPDAGSPTYSAEMYLFTPLSTWTARGSMGTARARFAAAAIGANIFVFGGGTGGGLVDTTEFFTSSTNTWAAISGSPTIDAAADSMTAVTYPGSPDTILLAGGSDGSPIATHESYNDATHSFTSLTAIPEVRSRHVAFVANDGVTDNEYIVSGINASSRVSTCKAWNGTNWTTVGNFTLPNPTRERAAASTANNTGVITGGRIRDNGNQWTKTVDTFDPATKTFTRRANLPDDARFGHSQATF